MFAFLSHMVFEINMIKEGALHLVRTHLEGVGGVKPPIHFHCLLHAKRGWVGPDSMSKCVRTKWKAPNYAS